MNVFPKKPSSVPQLTINRLTLLDICRSRRARAEQRSLWEVNQIPSPLTLIHFFFFFFLATPYGMWELRSPSRDQTRTAHFGRWSLNCQERPNTHYISQASRAMLLKVSPSPFISCVCFSLCYIVSGINPKYCCCWGGCYSHK